MNSADDGPRWRPTPTTLVAGALILLGLALTGTSWWFLLLTAAGVAGPGLLRELGWLADRDEFQRIADYRAGYHAYLVCSFAAFLLLAFFRSGERTVTDVKEMATLFVALACFTWLLSSLISFWGARRASRRILVAFGLAWLGFTILSNVGAEWSGWPALLIQPLITLPFFLLAWSAGRWPRITGLALLGVAGALFWFLNLSGSSNLGLMTRAVTAILFLGPLAGSGIALALSGAATAAPGGEPRPS